MRQQEILGNIEQCDATVGVGSRREVARDIARCELVVVTNHPGVPVLAKLSGENGRSVSAMFQRGSYRRGRPRGPNHTRPADWMFSCSTTVGAMSAMRYASLACVACGRSRSSVRISLALVAVTSAGRFSSTAPQLRASLGR